MKHALTLKGNVVWLDYLLTAEVATILLLGGDGHLVPVPASLLLAVSPLVRNILAEHFPPASSQSCISLPSATEDVLKVVRNILANGEVANSHENRMEEVKEVFEKLGVNALMVSFHSQSNNKGELDGKVENGANETVKVETVPIESEYFETFQKKELAISKAVNYSVFEDVDNVGTSAFEIKMEPDVAHLVNDAIQIIKEVRHKCSECKFACKSKTELKTHYRTSHGKKMKFYCQNCLYTCSNMGDIEYHCATTGHKANKDAAACKECDYIATCREELFKHKKKVHIPVGTLFECSDCPWVGKELHHVRHHTYSRDNTTKHDYEACALAKAEAMGSKAIAKYRNNLGNAIKRARKNSPVIESSRPKTASCPMCGRKMTIPLLMKHCEVCKGPEKGPRLKNNGRGRS